MFWKVAQEIDGLKVSKGVDAHNLSAFKDIPKAEQLIGNIEKMVSDKMITGKYNPVIARQSNSKLQQAYVNGQNNALTYETHMITQMVDKILSSVPDELDSENIALTIGSSLDGVVKMCDAAAKKKNERIVKENEEMDKSTMSLHEEKEKQERKKLASNETSEVLNNQKKAIARAKDSTFAAMSMGCKNKQEYSNMITQITQHKTTKNGQQKVQIENHVSNFQESKGVAHTNAKPLKLIKKNPNITNNGDNSNKGFVNVVALIIVLIFIIGVAVGIGYMLYRFGIGG